MAQFTSPQSGSVLRGSIEIFSWDLDGVPVEKSTLYVGSTPGASNHRSKSVGADTTTSLDRLPSDGSNLFLRLWYRTAGRWERLEEQYTAADDPAQPAVISPAPGAGLEGESQRFEWDVKGLSIESSWLYAGSIPGGSDYGAKLTGTERSVTIDGLPLDGSDVHVRLYFKVVDTWYFEDQVFTAATVAVPTKDELTRELQTLVGVEPDGDVGPLTRAALNSNWLGASSRFDPSFAARFTNDDDVVRWVQRRLNRRGEFGLAIDGDFGPGTEAAVIADLEKGGVVAAESFLTLLDP